MLVSFQEVTAGQCLILITVTAFVTSFISVTTSNRAYEQMQDTCRESVVAYEENGEAMVEELSVRLMEKVISNSIEKFRCLMAPHSTQVDVFTHYIKALGPSKLDDTDFRSGPLRNLIFHTFRTLYSLGATEFGLLWKSKRSDTVYPNALYYLERVSAEEPDTRGNFMLVEIIDGNISYGSPGPDGGFKDLPCNRSNPEWKERGKCDGLDRADDVTMNIDTMAYLLHNWQRTEDVHWRPPEPHGTQVAMTTLSHWDFHAVATAVNAVSSLSRFLRELSLPPGSRIYAMQITKPTSGPWAATHGVLLGVSSGNVYTGSITNYTIRPAMIHESTDPLIRSHGTHILETNNLNDTTWVHNGTVYFTSVESVGIDTMPAHFCLLIPKDVMLHSLYETTLRIRQDMVFRETDTERERKAGFLLMIFVVVACSGVLMVLSVLFVRAVFAPLQALDQEMNLVACMRLDNVDRGRPLSMLREVCNMQNNFYLMVDSLMEYRAHLPHSLLCVNDEVPDDISVTRKESTSAKSAEVTPRNDHSHIVSPRKLHTSPIRPKTAAVLVITTDKVLSMDSYDESWYKIFIEVVLEVVRTGEGVMVGFNLHSANVGFNTHRDIPRPAIEAARCALQINTQLKMRSQPGARRRWALAVETGFVFVGTVGDQATRSMVCCGKTIENAHLLCTLAHLRLRVSCVVGDSTYDRIRSYFDARPVDLIDTSLPGGRICVYQLISDRLPDPASESARNTILFHDGFSALMAQDFQSASSKFCEVLKDRYDLQAIRLLRLTLHAIEQPISFPRVHVGWEDYEAVTAKTPLPQPITDLIEVASPLGVSQNCELHPIPLLTTEGADEKVWRRGSALGLAEDIFHIFQSRSTGMRLSNSTDTKYSGPDSQAEPSQLDTLSPKHCLRPKHRPSTVFTDNSDTNTLHELPCEFTDRKGNLWYRSGYCVGKGQYGEVWLGMDSSGMMVALKSLPLPKTLGTGGIRGSNGNALNELLVEVGLLSHLRHENIVSYFGSAIVENHLVIAMEYLPGGSLASLLEKFETMPISTIQRYTKDMLRGLQFLHEQNIIHRDFKPGNVLLQIDGLCKLADFGASSHIEKVTNKPGQVIGTPLYMAPEACKGKADYASDIWGLGITVLQMITGKLPYPSVLQGNFDPRRFMFQLSRNEDFNPEIPEDLDPQAVKFITSCVNRDPTKRLTAEQLLLDPFLHTPVDLRRSTCPDISNTSLSM